MSVIKNVSDYVYVTCDGVGEGETMSIYTIDDEYKIKKIWTNFYPNSIGLLYSAITHGTHQQLVLVPIPCTTSTYACVLECIVRHLMNAHGHSDIPFD